MSRFIVLAALLALLPSCAYMQTHKNVLEKGQAYQGYKLDKPKELFRSGGDWFVAAAPAEYRLHHDFVHDNVFRKSGEPEMVLQALTGEALSFHRISDDTATVLLRPDGYVDQATLAQEVKEMKTAWLPALPHASSHAVRAEVVGPESAAVTAAPTPDEPSLGYRVLSGLDLVLVDAPGTVLYNVAVPVIAPFVFFCEFLSEE